MASLRNAVPRKTHKERAQPAKRARLGLLEKHKDYVERAQDFHRKVERINNLKKKAAERNPDEFYFGMVSAKTRGGVHQTTRANGADTVPHAEIKLMKSQDLSYLHVKKAVDTAKAAKLQQQLHLISDKPASKHTIFLDDQRAVKSFDATEHFDTVPELADRTFNRPRRAALEENGGVLLAAPRTMGEMKKLGKQREGSYRELDQRLKRADKLQRLISRKQTEKDAMGKGRKRKVVDAEGGKPAVFKWKRQRAK